jgi:hypothetical protein
VAGIAARRLLRPRQQHLLMANKQRTEGTEFIGDRAQSVGMDGRSRTRDLMILVCRDSLPSSADVALATPSRPTMAVSIILHLDDQRNDAGMWKVHAIDGLAWLRD